MDILNKNQGYTKSDTSFDTMKTIKKSSFFFIVSFIFIAVIIGVFIFIYYLNQKNSLKQEAQNNLKSIADLKVSQITNWRNQLLGDAYVTLSNNLTVDDLKEFHKKPTQEKKNEILHWFDLMRQNLKYKSIFLFDNKSKVILSEPENEPIPGPVNQEGIDEVVKSKKVILSDFNFYKNSDSVHLDLFIPLLTNKDSTVTEVILIVIDPYNFLYPRLQSWPTDSKTGESLLVEADGDSVLYLNDLRHQRNTALRLKIDLREDEVLAVKAAKGISGLVEGIDYRHIPVIGIINPVPNTKWVLITKQDSDEIYEAVNRVSLMFGIITIIILFSGGTIIGFYLYRRRARYFEKLYTLESEKKALSQHFNYLVKYANDIIILSNGDNDIIEANERAISIYGYSREEILKMKMRYLRPPEIRQEIESVEYKEKIQSGIIYETIHMRKDGKEFPVEISSRLIKINEKSYFQAIIRDITERKNAEEKISHLNRIYTVVSHINQAIVRIKDQQLLFEEVCRISIEYGKFRMAWIGILDEKTSKIIPVAHDGFVNGYLDNINISIRDNIEGNGPTGRAFREKRYILCNDILNDPSMEPWRAQAISRNYRSSGTFPIIVNDEVAGVVKLYSDEVNYFNDEELILLEELILDISFALENFRKESQRKEAIETLVISENKFKTLFENADDLILLMNGIKIIESNKKAIDYTGYSEKEIINKTILDFTTEYQSDGMISSEKIGNILKSIKEGEPQRFEWFIKKKNGDLIESEISLSSVDLGSKKILLADFRDISDRKKYEQGLKESKEKAEEMSKLKSNFLANMSHELRTPMTGILGFAEILYEELEEQKYKEMADIILRGGSRLTNTLNLILDLSRIEADKISYELKPVRLSEAIYESLNLYEATAKEKNLKLLTELSENIYSNIDVRLFEQVLNNLIKNAILYTEKGYIKITSGQELRNNQNYVYIKISDTGIGIPKELQGVIFEPFRQASEGYSRKFEGTGLGLTISKRFIELMKGEIILESEPEKGTTFTIYFPAIIMTSGNKTDTIKPSINKQYNLEPNFKTKKVLLVEDDDYSIFTIEHALKDCCIIDTVNSGLEALEKVKRTKYDLILMDIGLKGISGTETTQKIRRMTDYKFTPIVAITAYAMTGDKEKFLKAGCSHYISKPFSLIELKSLIYKLLENQKINQPSNN